MAAVARVIALSYAPVKALQIVPVQELEIGPEGVADDREFFVVDPDGKLLENPKGPKLIAIAPERTADGLALTFPDGTRVDGPAVADGADLAVAHYDGRLTNVRVTSGPHADALSAYLGRPVSLALRTDPTGGWGDFPITLSSQASLEEVAGQLGVPGLEAARFRHTIELDGIGAREEEAWTGRDIAAGEAILRVDDPVARCSITTLNPVTGKRDQPVLKGLRQLRGKRDVRFGVWATVVRPGRVAVGDAVGPID